MRLVAGVLRLCLVVWMACLMAGVGYLCYTLIIVGGELGALCAFVIVAGVLGFWAKQRSRLEGLSVVMLVLACLYLWFVVG